MGATDYSPEQLAHLLWHGMEVEVLPKSETGPHCRVKLLPAPGAAREQRGDSSIAGKDGSVTLSNCRFANGRDATQGILVLPDKAMMATNPNLSPHGPHIYKGAQLGPNVLVFPSTAIGEGARIGLGEPCKIVGADGSLPSYAPTIVGFNTTIGPGTTIERGSQLSSADCPTINRCTVGANVQLGRATRLAEHTNIGDGVEAKEGLHLGKHARLQTSGGARVTLGKRVTVGEKVVIEVSKTPAGTVSMLDVADRALIGVPVGPALRLGEDPHTKLSVKNSAFQLGADGAIGQGCALELQNAFFMVGANVQMQDGFKWTATDKVTDPATGRRHSSFIPANRVVRRQAPGEPTSGDLNLIHSVESAPPSPATPIPPIRGGLPGGALTVQEIISLVSRGPGGFGPAGPAGRPGGAGCT